MTMLPPDPLFVIRGDVAVTCLAFCADRSRLYSGHLNGAVIVWSLKTYREVEHIQASPDSLLALHPVENDLVVQTKMGELMRWTRGEDGKWVRTWSVAVDWMGFCESRVLGDVLVSALASGGLEFIHLADGKTRHSAELWGRETSGELMALAPYVRNGAHFIAVATERADVGVWTWTGEACGAALRLEECAMALALDASTLRGAAAGVKGVVTTFTVTEAGVTAKRVIRLPCPGVAALTLRPDARLAAAGCWDGKLRLLSWKSMVGLAVLPAHLHTVQAVAFTRDAPYLMAGGCKDGLISIWDLYNART